MNIYHDMYNLDYLDDIMKGVKPPSDILKTQTFEIMFMEVESSVIGQSRPTWVVSPPRNIDHDLLGIFPRPPLTHQLLNKGNYYKGKRYPLEDIKNLLVANANRSMLNLAAYDP